MNKKTTISRLRNHLCTSLSISEMLWLGNELTNCAHALQKEYKNPLPNSIAELDTILDESEKQFDIGEYFSNEEVKNWINNELSKEENYNYLQTETI